MSATVVVQVPVRESDMPFGQQEQDKLKDKILNAARIQWGSAAEVELRAMFRRIPGLNGVAVAEFTMWKVEE